MRRCALAIVGLVTISACARSGAAILAADPKVTIPAPPSSLYVLGRFTLGESSEAADEFWRQRAVAWRKRYDKMTPSQARWARQLDDEMDETPYAIKEPGPYVVPQSVRLVAAVGGVPSDALVTWANQNAIAFRMLCPDEALPMALERMECVTATDVAMQRVGTLTHLVVLGLTDTSVTDAGLASLVGLQRLQALDLSMSDQHITDAGMKHVRKLTNLAQLVAWRSWIGDAGLRDIAELPNLVDLNVAATKVTDAGILLLAKLPKLRRVRVQWTAVTEAGCKALDRAIGRRVCDRYTGPRGS